jgi:hypothetical protein
MVEYVAGVFALLASIAAGVVVVNVARRVRRASRSWPTTTMHGARVRVAPHVGPVVIGFLRPEIVVPHWVLERPDDEQRLVVSHELEHVRARDPLFLGLGWLGVILTPWNPAVWYMLSRLRLAIELDCDARVLRRGAAMHAYGSLLLDVAQHASPLRTRALALADDSSHLQQRILAMQRAPRRFDRSRPLLATVFAFSGIFVACQASIPRSPGRSPAPAALEAPSAPAPTEIADRKDSPAPAVANERSSKRIDAPDAVRPAPARVRQPSRLTTASDSTAPVKVRAESRTTPLIYIDGVLSTEMEMLALERAKIARVDVLKGSLATRSYGEGAEAGVILITMKRDGIPH